MKCSFPHPILHKQAKPDRHPAPAGIFKSHPFLWTLGISCAAAGAGGAWLYHHYLPTTRLPDPHTDYPYALLLGCPNRKDGTYSTSQKQRCNLAIQAWENHMFQTLVISGAAVRNSYVECEEMARYIHQHCDMPIILEDQARNTWENLENTRKLIGDQPILILTGSLHARRASAMARNFFSHYGMLFYADLKPKRILREIPSRIIYVNLELQKDLRRLSMIRQFLTGGQVQTPENPHPKH